MLDAFIGGNGLFLLLAFIAFIQLGIWLWPFKKARYDRALRAQERMQNISSKLSPAVLEVIKDTLRSGRKIEAIKQLRAETDAGLLDAKNFVEKLAADMAEE